MDPELGAWLFHKRRWELGEYSADGGDQTGFGVVGGHVGDVLDVWQNEVVQRVQVRRGGWPVREGYKVVALLLKSSLGLFGLVVRGRVLLLHPGSATSHLIAAGDHHTLQHIQVHFGVDFQADFEDVRWHDVALTWNHTRDHNRSQKLCFHHPGHVPVICGNPDLHFDGAGNSPIVIAWIGREHDLYSGASPISLVEHCVTFGHDRRLLSLLGFVHDWPTSRWSATKKRKLVFIQRKWNHVVFSIIFIIPPCIKAIFDGYEVQCWIHSIASLISIWIIYIYISTFDFSMIARWDDRSIGWLKSSQFKKGRRKFRENKLVGKRTWKRRKVYLLVCEWALSSVGRIEAIRPPPLGRLDAS